MKISTTILSATLLAGALALAGCGGSGNEAMDDDMDMDSGPTAEEKLAEAEAEIAKRDKAEAEAKAAADAKAALAMAQKLHDVLAGTDSEIKTDTMGKDANDEQNSMSISVMGKAFSKAYPSTLDGVSSDGKNTLTIMESEANPRIMGSAFSTSELKVHTQDKTRTVGDANQAYFSTSGSYHGVAGTYECVATGANGCTSKVDAGGDGIVLVGTWKFTPSDANAPVSAADGVKWGWWLEKAENEVSHAHVYYMKGNNGLVAVTDGLPSEHGGKATYMGDAIGQYSVYGGANGKNDSGAFEADATLQATFGTSAAISGTIDNFMGADGMPRMWSVELMKTPEAENLDTDTGVISGGKVIWTMDGAKGGEAGEWQVSAYGSAADSTDDPSAVAGAFKAEHETNRGRMIGAFGAEKQ